MVFPISDNVSHLVLLCLIPTCTSISWLGSTVDLSVAPDPSVVPHPPCVGWQVLNHVRDWTILTKVNVFFPKNNVSLTNAEGDAPTRGKNLFSFHDIVSGAGIFHASVQIPLGPCVSVLLVR